jgi:hypothetical protein
MMNLGASLYAISQGTFVINAAFFDENGAPATPISASWTLTDINGTVQNSRLNVVISPIAQAVQIVLSGADINYGASASHQRTLTLTALYVSSLSVTPLPLVDSCTFYVANPITGNIGP